MTLSLGLCGLVNNAAIPPGSWVIVCTKSLIDQLNIEHCFVIVLIFELFVSIISSLPAIYRHCTNDYLGFDISLICHGLGLGLAFFGLGLGWSCCLVLILPSLVLVLISLVVSGLGLAFFGLGWSFCFWS